MAISSFNFPKRLSRSRRLNPPEDDGRFNLASMNITGADAARRRIGLPGLNCRGRWPDCRQVRAGDLPAGPTVNGAWKTRAAAKHWKAGFSHENPLVSMVV